MCGRGIDFLENWIHQNVTDADRHGDHNKTLALAERCEAAAQGITIGDMEPEWGRVETIIYEAM